MFVYAAVNLLFMFEFKHCRERILWAVPSSKFKYFVTLLGENYIIDKCNAVDFLRKICNKKSNIECELIVYALDNIVNNVKSKCAFYCWLDAVLKI